MNYIQLKKDPCDTIVRPLNIIIHTLYDIASTCLSKYLKIEIMTVLFFQLWTTIEYIPSTFHDRLNYSLSHSVDSLLEFLVGRVCSPGELTCKSFFSETLFNGDMTEQSGEFIMLVIPCTKNRLGLFHDLCVYVCSHRWVQNVCWCMHIHTRLT